MDGRVRPGHDRFGLAAEPPQAKFDKAPARLKRPAQGRLSMATEDVQGKDQTKLANGGGAFPFWVSVVIVAVFFAVLFGAVYGIVQLF